jgi:asparagine synthase (glutamine-hydrolysing)
MIFKDPVERVVDLTDPDRNIIYNMTLEEARAAVASGDPGRVGVIDGQFAIVAVVGKNVRMARSISRPLRFFIAKLIDGPCLIAADRIDIIHRYLVEQGLDRQFHPSYTRMVPAHHLTEVALVGCPDPSPRLARFFKPERGTLSGDVETLGAHYIGALADEIGKWLRARAREGPIGVCFSGGIDSGSVFIVTYHTMLKLGMSPSRLKAFTLDVEGGGADLDQSRRFLKDVGLEYFLEPIEATQADIDWRNAVAVIEDYKPLDVQAAAMAIALGRGIRKRYPDWRLLIDGDGGDENLKDYPIEDNPELTIRSVLNNSMLYQEGWGVDAIKHSLTYSGGLSRAYTRTYASGCSAGFEIFSPYTLPRLIEIAEGMPFIALTEWSHDRLYQLKGDVVAAGVKAVTGITMPVYPKRRFQHGATAGSTFADLFPSQPADYRRAFHSLYEGAARGG